MKPYLEHISASQEGSWTLFDRRLPAIPFEWHYNREYELTLTLNSRGQRFIGDSMAPYDDGDLVLIGPTIPHTWCSSQSAGVGVIHQALVLWFSEDFIESLVRSHIELRSVQVMLESSMRAIEFSPEVRHNAKQMICAMLHQTAEDRLPALLQLLLFLSRDRQARPLTSASTHVPSAATEERIARVLSYLHTNYRDHSSVETLAGISALSPSSMHRLFKVQTGMTVSAYVARLRVGNACALLVNSDRPIALIADDVGYRNLAHFNRQFRTLKSKTPREFRRAFHLHDGVPRAQSTSAG